MLKSNRRRHILTVIDVLSRYEWLRPLKGHSAEVARHLEHICNEHGTPKVTQHDQGKGVQRCCKKKNNLWSKMKSELFIPSPEPG